MEISSLCTPYHEILWLEQTVDRYIGSRILASISFLPGYVLNFYRRFTKHEKKAVQTAEIIFGGCIRIPSVGSLFYGCLSYLPGLYFKAKDTNKVVGRITAAA